jgi:hypothetical protein
MLSIGGIQEDALYSQEPWPKGLGIFDMTTLNWTNAYDAAALAYEQPSLVSQFYAHNSRYPIAWIDPVLQSIFAAPNGTANASPTVSSLGIGGSSTQTSGSSGGSNGNGSSNNNAGAIAGGTVSAVAALALIGALTYWGRRQYNRKGRQSQNPRPAEGSGPPFEVEPRSRAVEMLTNNNAAELVTNANYHEVPGCYSTISRALELPA